MAHLPSKLVPPAPAPAAGVGGNATTRVDTNAIPAASSPITLTAPPVPKTDAQIDFEAPFHGNAHHHLDRHIQDQMRAYSSRSHFGRIIPIIQSPGTGKSRTFDQTIRTIHPGLHISLDSEAAWPLYDLEMASWLCRHGVPAAHPGSGRAGDGLGPHCYPVRTFALVWIEAIAHCAAAEIQAALPTDEQGWPISDDSHHGPPPASFAAIFYNHMESAVAASPSVSSPPSTDTRRRRLLQHVSARLHQHAHLITKPTNDAVISLRQRASKALNRFEAAMSAAEERQHSATGSQDRIFFLLALDGAALVEPALLSELRFQLFIMEGYELPFCPHLVLVLIGSSTCLVSDDRPSVSLMPGGNYEDRMLLPEFSFLPYGAAFRDLAPDVTSPHGKRWQVLLCLLSKKGRPLLDTRQVKVDFNTQSLASITSLGPLVGAVSLHKLKTALLNASGRRLAHISSSSFALAIRETTFPPYQEVKMFAGVDQNLAVLGKRLCLRFEGGRGMFEIRCFLQRQVKCHLGTVRRVRPESLTPEISAPSEPLLSLAAADLFRQQDQEPGCYDNSETVSQRWKSAIHTLRIAHKFYGLQAGPKGELVVCLLLAQAIDYAVVQKLRHEYGRNDARFRDDITDSTIKMDWRLGGTLEPCSLGRWLDQLFGEGPLDAALDGYETRVKRDLERRQSEAVVEAAGATPSQKTPAPGKLSNTKGLRWIKNRLYHSRINFTHFVPLGDGPIATISKDQLARLFVDHAALLVTGSRQAGWDILIPVLEGGEGWDRDETIINVDNFTFLAVRIVNRFDFPFDAPESSSESARNLNEHDCRVSPPRLIGEVTPPSYYTEPVEFSLSIELEHRPRKKEAAWRSGSSSAPTGPPSSSSSPSSLPALSYDPLSSEDGQRKRLHFHARGLEAFACASDRSEQNENLYALMGVIKMRDRTDTEWERVDREAWLTLQGRYTLYEPAPPIAVAVADDATASASASVSASAADPATTTAAEASAADAPAGDAPENSHDAPADEPMDEAPDQPADQPADQSVEGAGGSTDEPVDEDDGRDEGDDIKVGDAAY
ncbi:uncharacterized protein PFL1_06277 [Pseudozyma flocculosa PF-1]|uniref:Uncharacterized protein n=2 Tax=Pseudozyma flocculosa TaxID=84751 RepID=A0A5C3F7E1_9BASI|nr:uncharacterized protein PFL1_06277 [Pseudozyma flocculosa PF-1]EPQ26069.1 hypothetical protein PFL1_06277 [Pseudozyma flocculosa PF-1]SPO40312.1 uncharacterized protein PSFLO_05794 [Pseudozyma flocculosa]